MSAGLQSSDSRNRLVREEADRCTIGLSEVRELRAGCELVRVELELQLRNDDVLLYFVGDDMNTQLLPPAPFSGQCFASQEYQRQRRRWERTLDDCGCAPLVSKKARLASLAVVMFDPSPSPLHRYLTNHWALR